MISSGASWLPRSDTHGSPTSSANCSTSADLPIPGAPHINTGLLGAIFRSISSKSFWLTVIGKFICTFLSTSRLLFYYAVFRYIVSSY